MGRLIGNVRTYRNWWLHYRNRHGLGVRLGQRLELRLRNGLVQVVRGRTADMATSRSIFVDHSYLPPPLAIPADATVVDIGGHIGLFTMFAALRAPRGRLLVYEPEPENFALLGENLRRNGLEGDRVRAFPLAVAAEPGERDLHYADARGTVAHSLHGTSSRTFRVQCTTLPRILREHGLERVDFLKLDCEGAEVEILQSLADDELLRIRQVVMEVHDDAAAAPVRERMQRLGFAAVPHRKPHYRCFCRA